jgi:hypothetical protein
LVSDDKSVGAVNVFEPVDFDKLKGDSAESELLAVLDVSRVHVLNGRRLFTHLGGLDMFDLRPEIH